MPTVVLQFFLLFLSSRVLCETRRSAVECCETGRQLFTASGGACVKDISTEAENHCLVVKDVCCLAERRHRFCRQGVLHGLTAVSSRRLDAQHCQSIQQDSRECCGCCLLGRLKTESSSSCDPPFYLSDYCRQSYIECCMLDRQPSLTTATQHAAPLQQQQHMIKTITQPPTNPCLAATHNCSEYERCVYTGHGDNFTCLSMVRPTVHHVLTDRHTTVRPVRRPSGRCASGYLRSLRTGRCEDIDECMANTDRCAEQGARCVNTPGSFYCVRPTTSSLPTTTTTTTATTHVTPIPRARTRTKTRHQFTRCPRGFAPGEQDGSCVDIDECQSTGVCSNERNVTCQNTVGSYSCVCRVGFSFNPRARQCQDVDECTGRRSSSLCSIHEECVNTVGSYLCHPTASCTGGYHVDAATHRCVDVDECSNDSRPCAAGTVCVNTAGSYHCTAITCTDCLPTSPTNRCQRGYQYEPTTATCVDVNECESRMCRPNQVCVNTPGSYVCHSLINCGRGYQVNAHGNGCDDIDECAAHTDNCSNPLMICVNRPGSFVCQCQQGFQLNHRTMTCEDVDECHRYGGQVCAQNAICENTVGSFKCMCHPGFQLDVKTNLCKDVNECTEHVGICQHICRNTWGSFYCTCYDGYQLSADDRTCTDIDECTIWGERSNQLCLGICHNTPGSYQCTCPEGYQLNSDGRTCQDIDECTDDAWECSGPDDICVNTRGGHMCHTITCPGGFIKAPRATPITSTDTKRISGSHSRPVRSTARRSHYARPSSRQQISTDPPHLRSVLAKPDIFYANDESGVVCIKVECPVNDISCLLNLTRSIQWQHVSIPSISAVNQPVVLVDVQTVPVVAVNDIDLAFDPTSTDSHATTFTIIAGNDDGLFDYVDQSTDDNQLPDASNLSTEFRVKRGSVRLLRPVSGPSEHILTLQMDVLNQQHVIMSQHLVHITIFVSQYSF